MKPSDKAAQTVVGHDRHHVAASKFKTLRDSKSNPRKGNKTLYFFITQAMTFIYIIHFSEVNTDAQPSKHKRKGNIGCSCFANFCGFWDSGVSSVDHITNLQKITIMIYYIVLKRSPGQALTSATLLPDGASMISPDMKDS